jgi:hypothetical protein
MVADSPRAAALGMAQYGAIPVATRLFDSSGFKPQFKATPPTEDNVHHAVATLGGAMLLGSASTVRAVIRDAEQAYDKWRAGRNDQVEGEFNDINLDLANERISVSMMMYFSFGWGAEAERLAHETWCTNCD